MKKIILVLMLLLFVGSVAAIGFYGHLNMKKYNIFNATNISADAFYYNNGTLLNASGGTFTGGTLTSNLNMSNKNITNVQCIVYTSGGMDCSG